MSRKTFDSSEYRAAMKAFDGLHCLGCGRALPPLTSRKDRARVGSVLMKCCNEECKATFLTRTLKNWAELRLKVIARDSYTCQDCGYTAPWNLWIRYLPKKSIKLSDIESRKAITSLIVSNFSEESNWYYKVVPGDACPEYLEVHHIRPISEGGDEFDINNCISLCYDCHKARHSRTANIARKHATLDRFAVGVA